MDCPHGAAGRLCLLPPGPPDRVIRRRVSHSWRSGPLLYSWSLVLYGPVLATAATGDTYTGGPPVHEGQLLQLGFLALTVRYFSGLDGALSNHLGALSGTQRFRILCFEIRDLCWLHLFPLHYGVRISTLLCEPKTLRFEP